MTAKDPLQIGPLFAANSSCIAGIEIEAAFPNLAIEGGRIENYVWWDPAVGIIKKYIKWVVHLTHWHLLKVIFHYAQVNVTVETLASSLI